MWVDKVNTKTIFRLLSLNSFCFGVYISYHHENESRTSFKAGKEGMNLSLLSINETGQVKLEITFN